MTAEETKAGRRPRKFEEGGGKRKVRLEYALWVASQQIQHWIKDELTPEEAMQGLGYKVISSADWGDVAGAIVRWYTRLNKENPMAIPFDEIRAEFRKNLDKIIEGNDPFYHVGLYRGLQATHPNRIPESKTPQEVAHAVTATRLPKPPDLSPKAPEEPAFGSDRLLHVWREAMKFPNPIDRVKQRLIAQALELPLMSIDRCFVAIERKGFATFDATRAAYNMLPWKPKK